MASSVLFGRSADDGETWLEGDRLVTEAGGSPSLLCDDNGRLYCMCNATNRIAMWRSWDMGDTWTDSDAAPRYNPCHFESPRLPFEWADSTSFHLVYSDYLSGSDFDYEIFYAKVDTAGEVLIPRNQLSAVSFKNNFDFARSMVVYDDASILVGACQRLDWDWGGTIFGVPYILRGTVTLTGAEGPEVSTTILGHPTLFPNPTRDRASLRYSLESRADVTAAVYDVGGRLVSQLLKASVGPGTHLITWDGRNSAGEPATKGVYVLRVQAGESDWSRKVVIKR